MDFNIVKRQIIGEYIALYGSDRKDEQWNLGNVLNVFRYYYRYYMDAIKKDHPKLTNKAIRDIIIKLPYTVEIQGEEDVDALYEAYQKGSEKGYCPIDDLALIELSPEEYPLLIQGYFQQNFDGCNYSISHFMSGNIRTMRFYETLY